MKKPVVLTIIDGLGISNSENGNAWSHANTPFLDELLKSYPNVKIEASGKAVGLPEGQMGNSEAGHLNIGAGEVVYTGLSLVNDAIEKKQFANNEAFITAMKNAKDNNKTMHVMGLFSNGGVHSQDKHLFAIMEMLHDYGLEKVVLHLFGDGRDVHPKSLMSQIKVVDELAKKYNFIIGSISGRFFAMDRDKIFERTEKTYQSLLGNTDKKYDDVVQYISDQYDSNITDEFLEPAINNKYTEFLSDGDSVIFFNFRPDRARQLTHLIIGSDLYEYNTSSTLKNITLVSLMKYEGIDKAIVAFDSMIVKHPIGKVLSDAGKTQLRIAETQKYAHVTFFMDGGEDVELKGADRILIDSLKVDNFATVPQMSANEITDALIPVLNKYDVVIMNYANPDMVGHTGSFVATKTAVEIIDENLKKLFNAVNDLGGTMFITADHGNAEIMLDENNEPATKHTSSLVPFISTDKNIELTQGKLANITPTILDYIDVDWKDLYDEESLIK